ncbi:MAG: threonine ammonia-lyase [Acidobacteria bacterium]|nr:MAG: threonine ammonia-lyase [Acidobacteriota bacterium]
MAAPLLTREDVEEARRAIAPFLSPTPLRRAFSVPGGQARLKLECWQPTGSFKVRGALSVMAALSVAERQRGVVAASAGNHALGVAHAIQALGGGVHGTLFVPETAPRAKVDKLRTFRVTVVEGGATYEEAAARAQEHAVRTGAYEVHAFQDSRTAAGQGTVALEILEQEPETGTLVVPVGGGGLITGMAAAVKEARPDVRIVAVQPEASPSLRDSLAQGRPLLDYPARPTLADGIAGGIGEIVYRHRHLIDEVVTVAESEIEDAIVALVAQDQVIAEGAGAVGVAALRSGRVQVKDGRPVAVVITGANIDARVLGRLLGGHQRGEWLLGGG